MAKTNKDLRRGRKCSRWKAEFLEVPCDAAVDLREAERKQCSPGRTKSAPEETRSENWKFASEATNGKRGFCSWVQNFVAGLSCGGSSKIWSNFFAQ